MKIGKFHFGYSAIEDKGRRKAPVRARKREIDILTDTKRRKLMATAEEQQRNLSLVAWMVRKHLDYVSRFHFSFKSEFEDLNAAVNRMFNWHARPNNFDVLGKFGREEMFRFFEMEKVIAGDAALLKLGNGKLQAIESDLIARGTGAPPESEISEEGFVFDEIGKPVKAAICERGDRTAIKFKKLVSFNDLIFDAYWSRFGSQFRGVSPLSTAINTMQDLCDSTEFNLLKQKAQALFGLAIERESENGVFGDAGGVEAEDSEDHAASLDLRPDKVLMMDLNPGEKVTMLESRTPSAEFINGSYLFIQLAMLALDIPITSFDSRRSSFSARIADLNEYEVSASYKRDKNRYVRQAYSDWLIERDYINPVWNIGSIASKHGLNKRDVQSLCEWVASGSPWLDKYKQIQGDELAISLFIDNPIEAARRKGQDVFNNIDQIAKVIEYANKKGVPYNFGSTQKRTIDEMVKNVVDDVHTEKQEEDESEA